MFEQLKDKFNSYKPDVKRKVSIVCIILFVLIILSVAYFTKGSKDTEVKVKEEKIVQKTIDLTEKDEELSMRYALKNQINSLEANKQKEKETMALELEKLKGMLEQVQGNPNAINQGDLVLDGYPKPPNEPKETVSPPPIVIMGNIQSVSIPKQVSIDDGKPARKTLINFLPSGTIIKATLLNGMFAPTMAKGKDTPYPALFRVNDLTFLPNKYRKDLVGCFILGDGFGELSDSRVHIRLTQISCISQDEQNVLQENIQGFANGDDGKVGIMGEIRANFGKLALTALLAEFLSSAGEAVKSATQIETVNALGGITTQTKPRAEDISYAALGAGFAGAASQISKFYIDIMNEMSPVIEIYGRRNVELVIKQGVELKLDNYEWQGVLEDEKIDINSILNK